jgi:Tfp pilus assembly protein FimT
MNHMTKARRTIFRGTSAGFTIVELAVTVAIVTTLFAIAVPYTINNMKNRGVRNAADQLAMDLQRAKLIAIQRNVNCSVTINAPALNQYTISIIGEVVDLGSYPGGVVFSNTPDASSASVTFTPSGVCTNFAAFYLTDQKRRFRVRATGAGGISVNVFLGGQWT